MNNRYQPLYKALKAGKSWIRGLRSLILEAYWVGSHVGLNHLDPLVPA